MRYTGCCFVWNGSLFFGWILAERLVVDSFCGRIRLAFGSGKSLVIGIVAHAYAIFMLAILTEASDSLVSDCCGDALCGVIDSGYEFV